MWTIPNVLKQNLNPYSSKGYSVDYSTIVTRLDVKRTGGNMMAKWDPNDISTFIVFLFCRKGKIPPHSIELLNSKGEAYYVAPKKEDGSATTLMVDKQLVLDNLGRDGTLFIKVDLITGGNPFEAFAALGGAPAGGDETAPTSGGAEPARTVEIGEKKEAYDVMDD
ncbi:hypothetical protein AGDE_06922 [Angomonas deanei]|nr:hypothetical protein AGDE_06922 [Angomonas deanei]|eukprot:EPY36420.1 hypothetical protein AGDE_06922 [Angomonas deanei]